MGLLLLGACTGDTGAEAPVTGTAAPEPGDVGDQVPGEGGGETPGVVDGPRSTELIAQALSAGEITEQESVVRRVQARFDDPALPHRFVGAADLDPTALVEAWAVVDDLPADLADAVRPYLLRPTEAGSAFAPPRPGDGPTSAARNPAPAVFHHVSAGAQECPDWVSTSLEPAPFRVWACAGPGRAQGSQILGEGLEGALSATLQTMVLPRPYGMGRPLEDVPDHRQHRDNDGLIDIYVLPKGSLAPSRDGYQAPMQDAHGSDVYGQAIPAVPATPQGRGTSGYVLVDERFLGDHDAFLATVVHEVFHVQQFRFNAAVLPEVSWFMEASATWAELHFGPRTHREPYDWHLADMQTSPFELTADDPHEHQYQAFVWPLYMQQHAPAGPDSIFSVWEQLAGVTKVSAAEELLSLIGRQVPWHEHYTQFALQLLNRDLPGSPVDPLFGDVDVRFPGDTPDLAAMGREHRLPAATDPALDYLGWDGPGGLVPLGVPGLGYRFDRIVVDPGPLPESWGVALVPDRNLKETGRAAAMEVLLKEEGGAFRRVSVDPASGGTWCDVEEMIVVLTVPDPSASVRGRMTATVEEAPVCDLSGDLLLRASAQYRSPVSQLPAPSTAELQVSGSLDVVLGPVEERPKDPRRYVPPPDSTLPPEILAELLADVEMVRYYPDAGSTWTVTGTLVESTCVRRSFDCAPLHTVDFSTGDPAKLQLEVIEEDGQFTLVGSVPVLVTYTPHNPPGRTQSRESSWQLVCHTSGGWLSWGLPRAAGDIFLASRPDQAQPLGGPRERGSDVIPISCDNTWSSLAYEGVDEVSNVRETWTGQFRLGQ